MGPTSDRFERACSAEEWRIEYARSMPPAPLDFDRLLKLRLVVARFGEMDLAKWWNTRGQLGRVGSLALRRGFPRTHRFAQARSVFAVAAQRCREVFDPPKCVTLWGLPEAIEEEFNARWEQWLDHAAEWEPFFLKVEAARGDNLATALRDLDVVTNAEVDAASQLRSSAEGRAVAIPRVFSAAGDDVAMLALGFACGSAGALAVPYARMEG